ncbi:MAG: cation diffusion facilitator family transporter [Synechococcales bacterium]|nr:cation diffusion facilitator family transporter [Synechococcales bacterium]
MTDLNDRRWASYRVLLASLWLTLLVLGVKIWAGWATRSLSLLAEALHTLLDSFSMLLSLSLLTSPQPLTASHLWSHGRRETAGLLGLVAFLGFAGANVLMLAVQRLTQQLAWPDPVAVSLPLVQLLGVIIAINICLVIFERYEAGVLSSPLVQLSAIQGVRNIWLTCLVLLGLLGVQQGYVWLDPLIAIGLILLLVGHCWRVVNRQLPFVVRQMAIAPEVLAQLTRQVDGVILCRWVRSRGLVGRFTCIELGLVIQPEFLGGARQLRQQLEALIRERYGPVRVVIYLEGDRPA